MNARIILKNELLSEKRFQELITKLNHFFITYPNGESIYSEEISFLNSLLKLETILDQKAYQYSASIVIALASKGSIDDYREEVNLMSAIFRSVEPLEKAA